MENAIGTDEVVPFALEPLLAIAREQPLIIVACLLVA